MNRVSTAWARLRRRLAEWIAPPGEATPEASYRAYNGWYFGHFGEQERMLADGRRMDFYQAAIARHIQPGDRVIDLGTGTGILAAFAARRGAARVYAIDHSKIIRRARLLAAENGIARVEFHATHSREFTLPERVDVIVHEQMGDCLFDEAMVANVADLRDRLLKPGGLILPSRFEFFCEPVKLRDERRVPFIWELKVHGFDYACLERHRPQEPGYYRLRGGDLGLVDHFLGVAEPALTLDLQTVSEADLPAEIVFRRTVVRPGRLDGFAIYFQAKVDRDLVLSSSPVDPARAPHWGFRILRTEGEFCAAGDILEVRISAAPWSEPDSWRWSFTRRTPSAAGVPAATCGAG